MLSVLLGIRVSLLQPLSQRVASVPQTWWLVMFGLVVYMAEMGPLLHSIWKPLAVTQGL